MTQRKTGSKAASAAGKVLRDGRTGKASKTAAGSALSQAAPKRKAPPMTVRRTASTARPPARSR